MRKLLQFLSFAILVLVLLGAGVLYWLTQPVVPQAKEVTIKRGSLISVSTQLQDQGVRTSPYLMRLWQYLYDAKLRTGVFLLPAGANQFAVFRVLAFDPPLQGQITIPEGWTFEQMRALINAQTDIEHITPSWTNKELANKLGLPEVPLNGWVGAEGLEGWFFPDTYRYDKGAKDFDLLRTMNSKMQNELELAWQQRDPNTPLKSKEQALILASIVEKETGHELDRGKVAAVLSNRLRIGMMLQSDPTVIYGMGSKYDGNLRRQDLLTDTAYNSYTRNGLPPGPIALPGRASLLAAVKPDTSNAFYFVAKGDGRSEFSVTLSEHNRAVQKYQLLQK